MKTNFLLLVAVGLVTTVSVFGAIDDARLKEWLAGGLLELLIWKDFDIRETGATDEQFHRVLMELYREAEDRWPELTPGTDEWHYNQRIEQGILACLWMCGDIQVKDVLIDVAADTSRDGFLRTIAIGSYLRAADAEEARDVLLQFLAGERCGIDPLSVYSHAAEVYDQTPPEDEAKRRAIIAALMVAAAREEGKIGFVEVDRILAMRSDAYRRSEERLAMLEHHSLEPPTRNLYTDADLKAALAESRRYRNHTSVNTNAALLQAHDLSQEHTPENAEKWGGALITPSPEVIFAPRGVQSSTVSPRVHSRWFWAVSAGCLAFVVAIFILFVLYRRARDQ